MHAIKDNTVKLRIDDVTLELLEKARSYINVNKSKFIRQSIRDKAQEVIDEHEKVNFSPEDWKNFFAMIDNPPAPTSRMQKAVNNYQERYGEIN